jgi:hypothetical protein
MAEKLEYIKWPKEQKSGLWEKADKALDILWIHVYSIVNQGYFYSFPKSKVAISPST